MRLNLEAFFFYLLTHPSRGNPSHPTRGPGLSTALLFRSTLEHAITHSATHHLRPTHSFTLKLFNPPLHPTLSFASTSHAGTTHFTGPAESASSSLRSSSRKTSSYQLPVYASCVLVSTVGCHQTSILFASARRVLTCPGLPEPRSDIVPQ